MASILQHMKKVAREDVRVFFAPFVGVYSVIRKEMQRPPVRDEIVAGERLGR